MLENDSIDSAILCSVYDFIYGGMEREDRILLIEFIKESIGKGWRPIIVDKAVDVRDTPPHWWVRIEKDLIIDQVSRYVQTYRQGMISFHRDRS